MNILDLAAVAVIVLCILYFSYKGLVLAVFDAVSIFAAYFLANALSPKLTEAIRNRPEIFDWIKAAISKTLGLENLLSAATKSAETNVITSLNIPDFLKDALLKNNNAEIYKLLNADTLADYVSGFLANMLIGALSLVVLLLLVFIAMKIIGVILDIASKLPVINSLNKIGGALLGAGIGVFIVCALLAVASVLLTSGKYSDIITLIESSAVAKYFYEHNFIINALSGIIR